MCTLVDLGEGLCLFFSFSPLLGGLSLDGEPTCAHICPEKDSESQRCCCSCSRRTRWDVWEAGCWGGARAAAEPVLGPGLQAGATWTLVPLRPLEALHHLWVLCQSWSLEPSLEFYELSLHFVEEGAGVLVLTFYYFLWLLAKFSFTSDKSTLPFWGVQSSNRDLT